MLRSASRLVGGYVKGEFVDDTRPEGHSYHTADAIVFVATEPETDLINGPRGRNRPARKQQQVHIQAQKVDIEAPKKKPRDNRQRKHDEPRPNKNRR